MIVLEGMIPFVWLPIWWFCIRDHPREAKELYRQAAEAFIEHRNRESYKSACAHLRKVRALSKRLHESGAWEEYLSDLREQHRPLRALREEMDKAGL